MTKLHFRLFGVLSGTPRLTCVHPPDPPLASAFECLFLPRLTIATLITPGSQGQNFPRIRPSTSIARIIAAFKTHNS
jgi:hypothetical protein